MFIETDEVYEFGSFRLNVREHKLERIDGDKSRALPNKAFRTLVVLVRNHGRLLTKSELLDAVWPDTTVEENNLDKCIHAIRHALGEKPQEQKFIETVRKQGFRFVADVHKVEDVGHAAPPPNSRVDESNRDSILPLNVEEIDSASIATGRRPVEHNSSKPGYLRFAAAAGLIAAIAGGAWVAGGKLRPIAAPPGPQEPERASNGGETSARRSGRSPAYDLYVRGKVRVGSENREDTVAAISLLEEAVAIDPNFAEAYAQLARGYNTMAFKYASDLERKQFAENAEVAIEKALALKPDLAEGHFARGLILWTNTKRFPHEQAIRSYQRSLVLDPSLDETHHQLSLIYSHLGLLEEAARAVNKAIELNPNNTLARFRGGVNTAYQGKFDEAIAIFKTVPVDFTPMLIDRSTAEALIQTGNLNNAKTIVESYLDRFPKDEGGSFTSVKALLLAKTGKREEAEKTILHALEIGKGFGHFHHTTYNAASTYAALNKPEEAVRWLEFTAENGFPNYTYFQNDPNLDNIRNHKEFLNFMARLKPQWERFKSIV